MTNREVFGVCVCGGQQQQQQQQQNVCSVWLPCCKTVESTFKGSKLFKTTSWVFVSAVRGQVCKTKAPPPPGSPSSHLSLSSWQHLPDHQRWPICLRFALALLNTVREPLCGWYRAAHTHMRAPSCFAMIKASSSLICTHQPTSPPAAAALLQLPACLYRSAFMTNPDRWAVWLRLATNLISVILIWYETSSWTVRVELLWFLQLALICVSVGWTGEEFCLIYWLSFGRSIILNNVLGSFLEIILYQTINIPSCDRKSQSSKT